MRKNKEILEEEEKLEALEERKKIMVRLFAGALLFIALFILLRRYRKKTS